MSKTNNLTDFLTDIADAIREKEGSSDPINPQDFSDRIRLIQTGFDMIKREITSDENGMIVIEEVENYTYFNAVAFNLGQPLVVIRFGDNLYVGYYGGSAIPAPSTSVSLEFTPIPNITVAVYYIKSDS